MCPGGFIVPAASGPEQVVVNGMSPSNRGSRWSNSGMVVEIQPEDLLCGQWGMNNGQQATSPMTPAFPLPIPGFLGLCISRRTERQCWLQGGMNRQHRRNVWRTLHEKLSYDLPESSYSPGQVSSPTLLDAGIYQQTSVTGIFTNSDE